MATFLLSIALIAAVFQTTAFGDSNAPKSMKDAREFQSQFTFNLPPGHRRRLGTPDTSKRMDDALRKNLLDKHNQLRSDTAMGKGPCKCGSLCSGGKQPGATNMNMLFWDKALEKVAQDYADKCLFIHNGQRSQQAFDNSNLAKWTQTKVKAAGENLYVSSVSSMDWDYFFGDKNYGVSGGLQGWWDEGNDYDHAGTKACGGEVVGHYTQYVRADVRFVGCGVTVCNGGIDTESSTYDWASLNVVCNYMGSQYGDAPYIPSTSAKPVASECEPDRIPNSLTASQFPGLCAGRQAKNFFEEASPKKSKAEWDAQPASAFLCEDGLGRDVCGSAPAPSPNAPPPSPMPTKYPSKAPTNKPITPYPTDPPTSPQTPSPTAPTPAPPAPKPVTPSPTAPTPPPTTRDPTPAPSPLPTARPTEKPTPKPTGPPVNPPANCVKQDCSFITTTNWESPSWQYSGIGDACLDTKKSVLGITSGYSSHWSFSGYYEKVDGNWVLFIKTDVTFTWSSMDCALRDQVTAEVNKEKYKTDTASGVEAIMGTDKGKVASVLVSIDCQNSAAFGARDENGNVEPPFSTWNLNTYDFSDWFVLLFLIFTGCVLCFLVGWFCHRRKVFKALEDSSIQEFDQETPMVPVGNSKAGNNQSIAHLPDDDDDDDDDSGGYGQTNAVAGDNLTTTAPKEQEMVPSADEEEEEEDEQQYMVPEEEEDEPEIEVGVSVAPNQDGVLEHYD